MYGSASKRVNSAGSVFKRTTALFLVVLMLISACSFVVFADDDDDDEIQISQSTYQNNNDNISREIHVVYDNSGSMFMEYKNKTGIDRWAYAKYAMEAFVAMLNDQDSLKIYLMNPAKSLGVNYDKNTPIVISGVDKAAGIKIIHDMETTADNGNTPFGPVQTASRDYISDARYLVIITDGQFTQEDSDDPLSDSDLPSREVNTIASNGTKVIFLGMASAKLDANDNVYTKDGIGPNEIVDAVNDACNIIFERHPLNTISGNKVTLPVSMKKLVVLAQKTPGASAKLGNLEGAVTVSSSPLEIKSSDKSWTNSNVKAKSADLHGYVSTYSLQNGEAIPSGDYKIDSSGDIKIFYEPNIDVDYTLYDTETNEPVDFTDEIYAGEYKIEMRFVDALSGADVTNNELIKGKDKDNTLVARLKTEDGLNGEEVENGDVITLTESANAYIEVTGTYLDDYTITNAGSSNLKKFKIKENPFDSDVSTEKTYFNTANKNSWKNIYVDYEKHKAPISEAELKDFTITKVKLGKRELKEGVDYTISSEGNRYAIKLIAPSDGSSLKQKLTKQKLTVTSEFNNAGEVVQDNDSVRIRICNIVFILMFWLGVLIFLALVIAFLLHKVFPRRFICKGETPDGEPIGFKGKVKHSPFSKTATVSLGMGMDSVKLTLKKAKGAYWIKRVFGKTSVIMDDVMLMGGVTSFEMGAVEATQSGMTTIVSKNGDVVEKPRNLEQNVNSIYTYSIGTSEMSVNVKLK